MHFTSKFAAAAAAVAVTVVNAAPYSPFPLPDGFPAPTGPQLVAIEAAAGGALPASPPTSPPPSKLTAAAITTVQLIALNEIFEVAYFTDLLTNITTGVSGYNVTALGYNETSVVAALTAIQAQEQLHAEAALLVLEVAGAPTITPCQYSFPVSDFKSAIALAATFTDLVLGVLPQAQLTFATDGGDEISLIPVLGSIIGQEGEQDGWFRVIQGKNPSAAPFLTGEAPQFAFTALQSFIVPGSCPADIHAIGTVGGVTTFKLLNVLSTLGPVNSTATFSAPGSIYEGTNSVVYISGQDVPLTVPIFNVTSSGGLSYFEAEFPFQAEVGQFSKGLTIAAVVKGSGPFYNISAVAAATVYGPGLIEV